MAETGMILDNYEPLAAWFRHNPYGIHGIGHVARVLVWAEQVAQAMSADGLVVDIEVARWAAVLHDVGRVDDGNDMPHGARAADWVSATRALWSAKGLTDNQVAQIAYCCRWHVPPDATAPKMTTELACLKDADGLDRVRINDMNPAYFRHPYTRSLCRAAYQLFGFSSLAAALDPWNAVRQGALTLGLWK